MLPSAGDRFPGIVIKEATADGSRDVDPAALFAGKSVVPFTRPGAFTPTCSNPQLPAYVARRDAFTARGVDLVACLAVNDPWVMQAWAEQHGALGSIVMLADGTAALTRALGIDVDLGAAGLGVRCRRGMLLIKDGVITTIALEAPGKLEVSGADACLMSLA